MCKLDIKGNKRHDIQKHCDFKRHIEHLELFSDLISDQSNFYYDLCLMLLRANIPFHKLENRHFEHFIEKYAFRKLPNPATMRTQYLL